MTKEREALKLALEALEELNNTNSYWWQEVDKQTIEKIEPAITAIKEALAQPEQEPLWSDAGDLKRLKKGDVLRVLRKGQEYYSAFRFDGLLQECDYTYDGNAPFVWLEVGMATLDKIVYIRKDTTTGAIYADRGDRVEIFQHINKEALAQPEQKQQIETLKRCLFQMQEAAKDLVKQAKSLPPPQRTWVGLTDEEIDKAWRSCDYTVPWEQHRIDIARAIEAKLKEKNT